MIRSVTSHRAVRRLAIGGLVVLLAVAAVACGGGKKSSEGSQPQTFDVTTATATSTEAAASPSPEATGAEPAFPAPAADAKIMRLVIPAAKVDAPLQVKGLNARNEMENPDGKDNVAWYDFTGRPGFGSNAVFSGHVDWFTGQQGVFWYLRDLKQGDQIVVKMSDGTDLKYQVTSNETYPADSAPVAEIIGPTTKDTVTLITCDGVFNRSSQEYDKRRVVRAERVA